MIQQHDRHGKKSTHDNCSKHIKTGLSEFMRARLKFTRLHVLNHMRWNTNLEKSSQIFKADTFNNRPELSEQYSRKAHKNIQVSVSNNKFCTAISWSRSAPLMADWPWKRCKDVASSVEFSFWRCVTWQGLRYTRHVIDSSGNTMLGNHEVKNRTNIT